jgi:hypothetical protein
MYTGCNGATCVYTCCITVAHVYVQKFEFLTFQLANGELSFHMERVGHQSMMNRVWKKVLEHLSLNVLIILNPIGLSSPGDGEGKEHIISNIHGADITQLNPQGYREMGY